MDHVDTGTLIRELAGGFEALQEEYQKLFYQHQSLERKLATARQQYNELAKLCGSGDIDTPPLSLSSSSPGPTRDGAPSLATLDILDQRPDVGSTDAARKVRRGLAAEVALRQIWDTTSGGSANGVKIWAGPAADRAGTVSSTMPSISESPLEQDFTIEGKPSQLGCPFASMANRKLSSHAASVLSRYNSQGSGTAGPAAPSTPISSVSRINGRDSLSRRSSRRASLVDPIRAEVCGLDTDEADQDSVASAAPTEAHEPDKANGAEPGVCPIRFLDQHSPEEVATYFEKHKHEIPRSHEVCVRRYQSNEQQIRELDAKYGSLVSMIQGLGARHKDMLPDDPADGHEEDGADTGLEEARSTEKVRRWASNVSAQAQVAGGTEEDAQNVSEVQDTRQSHFERPLRDIRVGESPSRPWGISVPVQLVEEAHDAASDEPAAVEPSHVPDTTPKDGDGPAAPAGRCPFGFDRVADPTLPAKAAAARPHHAETSAPEAAVPQARPVDAPHIFASAPPTAEQPRMVFTGPVFLGFSAEEAAKILRESQWAGGAK